MPLISHISSSISEFRKQIPVINSELEEALFMKSARNLPDYLNYLSIVIRSGLIDFLPITQNSYQSLGLRLSPRSLLWGNGCLVNQNESSGLTLTSDESLLFIAYCCESSWLIALDGEEDDIEVFASHFSAASPALMKQDIFNFIKQIRSGFQSVDPTFYTAFQWQQMFNMWGDHVQGVLSHVWNRTHEDDLYVTESLVNHPLFFKIRDELIVSKRKDSVDVIDYHDLLFSVLLNYDAYDAGYHSISIEPAVTCSKLWSVFDAVELLDQRRSEFSPHWQAVIRQMREQTDYYTGEAHYELALSLRETNPLDAFQYFCVASASWSRVHKQLNQDIFKEVVALSEANGWQELRNYYRWVEEAL